MEQDNPELRQYRSKRRQHDLDKTAHWQKAMSDDPPHADPPNSEPPAINDSPKQEPPPQKVNKSEKASKSRHTK
jgi:hypothetical protein